MELKLRCQPTSLESCVPKSYSSSHIDIILPTEAYRHAAFINLYRVSLDVGAPHLVTLGHVQQCLTATREINIGSPLCAVSHMAFMDRRLRGCWRGPAPICTGPVLAHVRIQKVSNPWKNLSRSRRLLGCQGSGAYYYRTGWDNVGRFYTICFAETRKRS
jgi:hypothetical protein